MRIDKIIDATGHRFPGNRAIDVSSQLCQIPDRIVVSIKENRAAKQEDAAVLPFCLQLIPIVIGKLKIEVGGTNGTLVSH